MNRPFFSVVIPTYNRAKFIGRAIESVLCQSFQDFEIIVVDDGSTDQTMEVVTGFRSDKIQYFKKKNAERGAARNFGVQNAKGRLINFLDSDDFVYSNHLEVACEFYNTHRDAAIFHLGYDIMDEDQIIRKVDNIESINSQVIHGNILSCNGVFIKRELILQNAFNEDRALASLEDWELWIRMSSRFTFLNSNAVTSAISQHKGRSVMQADIQKIRDKVDCFIQHVKADAYNKKYFRAQLNKAFASAYTYASLHILMANGAKIEAFRYLVKGVITNPEEVMRRRFFVIAKKLIGL